MSTQRIHTNSERLESLDGDSRNVLAQVQSTKSQVGNSAFYRMLATTTLVFADLIGLFLVNIVIVMCYRYLNPDFSSYGYLRLWPLLLLAPLVFSQLHLYTTTCINPASEMRRVFKGTFIFYLLVTTVAFLSTNNNDWSRITYLLAMFATMVTLPFIRSMTRSLFGRLSWWSTPVCVLGAGATGEIIVSQLKKNPSSGLRPVAIFDDDPRKKGYMHGVPVVHGLQHAPSFACLTGIQHAVIAMPGSDLSRIKEIELSNADVFPHITYIPPIAGFGSMCVTTKDINGILGLEFKRELLRFGPRLCKRAMDLFLASMVTFLGAIPLITLAALVKLSSKGPIFYGQTRIGKNGEKFKAWKFRSMVVDADAQLKKHLAENPEAKAEWDKDHKLRKDPRITGIGKFLRITSLDELPQLINVFNGTMSLVGPRPIVDDEVEKYGETFELYQRVRPGVTGLWQVSGRNDTTYPERVALDNQYVRNWSPWLDLWILAKTIKVVVFRSGAY